MSKKEKSQSSPLAALHHLEFILQQKSDQLLRASVGIGFGQLRLIEGLSSSKPCSQRVLAHQLRQTEANISRQLRLLQKKGLVSINPHPKDKRQRQVKLTAEGEKIRKKSDLVLASLHKDVLSKIDYRDAFNFAETAKQLAKSL